MRERWYPGWGLALLRAMLGLIFLVHGWDKLFGSGIGAFTGLLVEERFPSPQVLAWLVTGLEFFGGLALLVGFLTRWAAAALFLEMVVAMATAHAENGFFVCRPEGQWGYEYHLALLGGLGCLFLAGGGRLSAEEWAVRIRTGGP